MKTIKIKRTINITVRDGEPNMKDIVESLNRAIRIWGVVKGLELGPGTLEFDIKTPKRGKKAA